MPQTAIPSGVEWTSLSLAHNDYDAGLVEIDDFFRSLANSPEQAADAGPFGGEDAAASNGVAAEVVVEDQVSVMEEVVNGEVADAVVDAVMDAVMTEAADKTSSSTPVDEGSLAMPPLPQIDRANEADDTGLADRSPLQMTVPDEVTDDITSKTPAASRTNSTIDSTENPPDQAPKDHDGKPYPAKTSMAVTAVDESLNKPEEHNHPIAENPGNVHTAPVVNSLSIPMLLHTDDELESKLEQQSALSQPPATSADIGSPAPEPDVEATANRHSDPVEASEPMRPHSGATEHVTTEPDNHVIIAFENETVASWNSSEQSLVIQCANEDIENSQETDTETEQHIAEAISQPMTTPVSKMTRSDSVGRSLLQDEMREEEAQGLEAVDDTPVKFATAGKAEAEDGPGDGVDEETDSVETIESAADSGPKAEVAEVAEDDRDEMDIDPVVTGNGEQYSAQEPASTVITKAEPDVTAAESPLPALADMSSIDEDDDDTHVTLSGSLESEEKSNSAQATTKAIVGEASPIHQLKSTIKRDRESASPDPLQGPPTKRLRGQAPQPIKRHVEAAALAVKTVRETRQTKGALEDAKVVPVINETTCKSGAPGQRTASTALTVRKTRSRVNTKDKGSEAPVDSGTESTTGFAKPARNFSAAAVKMAAPAAKPMRKSRPSKSAVQDADDEDLPGEPAADTATTRPSKMQKMATAATRQLQRHQLSRRLPLPPSPTPSTTPNPNAPIPKTAAHPGEKTSTHPIATRELRLLSEIIEPDHGPVKGKTRTKTRELEEWSAKPSAAAGQRRKRSGVGMVKK